MTNLLESINYEYRGLFYVTTGLLKMKCRIHETWHVAVKYKRANYIDGEFFVIKNSPEYVREYGEFIEKFKGA